MLIVDPSIYIYLYLVKLIIIGHFAQKMIGASLVNLTLLKGKLYWEESDCSSNHARISSCMAIRFSSGAALKASAGLRSFGKV